MLLSVSEAEVRDKSLPSKFHRLVHPYSEVMIGFSRDIRGFLDITLDPRVYFPERNAGFCREGIVAEQAEMLAGGNEAESAGEATDDIINPPQTSINRPVGTVPSPQPF